MRNVQFAVYQFFFLQEVCLLASSLRIDASGDSCSYVVMSNYHLFT